MAEWTHTYDPANALNDYQIRVAHLTGGGGLNVVGGLPVVLSSSTVHDNGVKDNLDGEHRGLNNLPTQNAVRIVTPGGDSGCGGNGIGKLFNPRC
jgi:hypothetical protein